MADPTSVILNFLSEIGIVVKDGVLDDPTFLPGISVENGGLIVDRARLKYPGDLLHEAAHLAVAPVDIRPSLNGEVVIPGTEPPVLEVAVMLWSYAACLHLQLDPRVVFHENGYHGHSGALLRTFALGVFPGVHILVDAGMTSTSESEASRFPEMKVWLRE